MRPGTTPVHSPAEPRNPGAPLDLDWITSGGIDPGRIRRRAEEVAARAKPAGHARIEALLRIIACIDLTSLSGDDTPDRIRRLCDAARHPLGPGLSRSLGTAGAPPAVAAVCVYPAYIAVAREALDGSGIPVAAVAAAFPHGLSPLDIRIAEVRACAALGAAEIDVVIRRSHALLGEWAALYQEIRALREAAGQACLKVILATGELGDEDVVVRAARTALVAGADFVKTSTGKEAVNATLPAGIAVAQAIREYAERTGRRAGIKPAGGIRTATHALDWFALVEEALGPEWLVPALFRIGASGLLADVAAELETLGAPPP